MTSARDALQRLVEGNARFLADPAARTGLDPAPDLATLAQGQAPFAAILTCADSRVPVERVFDQGFGDLFVVRVAGNVVTPETLGSLEFAVANLGVRLLVVLGHSSCGAVEAAAALRDGEAGELSTDLRTLLERIVPALGRASDGAAPDDPVRANVRQSVQQLRASSAVLAPRVESGELLVVGAEYSLDRGTVEFFDGVPA